MSYRATVLEIMIASPGDVAEERRIIREIIDDWNSAHSATKKIVLRPVAWETHSTPLMGNRPQAIINKQLLENCDLLIGVFWTRIGTPTGEFASGTAEEIETHIKFSKPAMIYFSTLPAVIDSVDPTQYEQLKAFKNECMKRGLIETFDSKEVFRDKLTRQLAKTINEDKYIAELIADSGEELSSKQSEPNQPPLVLSKEAIELLLTAAQGSSGQVLRHKSSRGTILIANKKQFGTEGDPRTIATWQSALQELVGNGFLQPMGNEGVVFDLTRRGYDFVDVVGPVREKPYPMVGPVFIKL